MNLALKIVTVVVAGTVLGLLATWVMVVRGGTPEGVSNGPWKTNLAIGSAQSDAFTRASVAVHGLFALSGKETIYYTATTDDAGQSLEGNCRYEITGRDPDARWWSITAYGADDFLIPNPANRYSVAKTTIARNADGSFVVEVGANGRGINRIPTGSGRFSLSLRLYNPGQTASLDPEHTSLPSLKLVSCT